MGNCEDCTWHYVGAVGIAGIIWISVLLAFTIFKKKRQLLDKAQDSTEVCEMQEQKQDDERELVYCDVAFHEKAKPERKEHESIVYSEVAFNANRKQPEYQSENPANEITYASVKMLTEPETGATDIYAVVKKTPVKGLSEP
ncbi:hypothetical protein XELAEV_18012322mg [Xenopus laevis]|uniref:Uncharacterized protein n=1 Tax=Xenopus laevis TaxID=8355 RepID=A0A974HYA3_XENLA|nr:hypothetical protein XELAEV_18012322mg [Xenopus laevis]